MPHHKERPHRRSRSLELDARLSRIAREGRNSTVEERRRLLKDMFHEEEQDYKKCLASR